MIVKVKLDLEAVRRRIGALTGVVRNTKGILLAAGDELLRRARLAFQEQHTPEGEPWAPLSEKYAKRKAQLWPGRPILQASRMMFRSLFRGVEGNTGFVEATPPYAAIHNWGGRAGIGGRARIPSRAYLPAEPLTEQVLTETAEEFLADAAGS